MNTLHYILLSGGLDSAAALACALDRSAPSDDVRTVSFDYGQRHHRELEAAKAIAMHYGVPHSVELLSVPMTMLTEPSVPVPNMSYAEIKGISPAYVPFRNGLMLSTLTAILMGRHHDPLQKDTPHYGKPCRIHWGAHAEDAEGGAYPDCSNDFIRSMGAAIKIGSYEKVTIRAPFSSLFKHEIVSIGNALAVPFHLTYSCYAGGEEHCGTCPTCRARRQAFAKAQIRDPTIYAAG